MENKKSGIQIGKRSFFTSIIIIFVLMMLAGVLTQAIPSGQYERLMVDGRTVIDPGSFVFTDKPDYPIYRWLTAPVEVLFSSDALMVVTIILFIFIIGGIFALLEKGGILHNIMTGLVAKYGHKKYSLLAVITGVFMIFGSAFGLFEELVVLVPIAIALAYSLGWDSLVGLGMSILAACFGFSATTLNPFTLGVAQSLAGLPAFSGLLFRIPVLLLSYGILVIFLTKYAKKIEKDPKKSLIFADDSHLRKQYGGMALSLEQKASPKAMKAFYCTLAAMGLVIVGGMVSSVISGIMLPLIALVFLVGSIIAAKTSGRVEKVGKELIGGISGTAPGGILILMAMSVKLIIENGQVMDTILHYAANLIQNTSPYASVILIYVLVLVLNFFIGSGSAKAFLIMPIIAPLTDLIDVTRQAAVTAFCLGDGLTNVLYPTNALLMITLGLTVVSYPKWFKFTIKLQLLYALVSVAILLAAVAVGLGPF